MRFQSADRQIEISAWSRNIIRFRISRDFAQTYIERYGILTPKAENADIEVGNSVQAGSLNVSYEDNAIIIRTPKGERRVSLDNSLLPEMNSYFYETLSAFRPERKKIVGDESADDSIKTVDFITDPKYITLKTEGEKFYGLGESNTDRIVLNGKAYLQKVIYTKSELVIPFIMTKAGYGIFSTATIWHGVDVCARNENEVVWYLPDGDIDFFIFAGDTLPAVLERFTYLTGRIMLMPKWAYGLTFIDQFNADQFEVMRNASTFREKKIPCDSFSLEPGWMAKRYDFSTEKKWNTDRFYICDWMRRTEEEFVAHTPRDRLFTTALSRYGFKLMLWLCCKYDFTANQENRAGNPTDFGFEPWFKHLKSFVCDGAAGFKMDPCKVIDTSSEDRIYANGRPEAEMHSLQVTLYGKEMYEGYSEYTKLRPMHHLSGGYTGSQRFSAATTGDSGGRFKTLVWMLNSGLSGFSNITCDMDIFAKHTIHFCFFTAWCELDSWSGYSHPWWAGDENEKVFTFYDRLRYHLLPYIYSAAIQAHIDGMPIMRAMPLVYDDEAVENAVTEYMFGDSFLVTCFDDKVYLPAGETWIDYWTGKHIEGGITIPVEYPDDRGGALFVKGGAIIPTQKDKQFTDCKDDEHLTLEIYPAEGRSSSYSFFEDDGRTLSEDRSETIFTLETSGGITKLTIGKREGGFEGMLAERRYGVKAFTAGSVKRVTADGEEVEFSCENGICAFETATGAREIVIEE